VSVFQPLEFCVAAGATCAQRLKAGIRKIANAAVAIILGLDLIVVS
jgi:hypothetical protein